VRVAIVEEGRPPASSKQKRAKQVGGNQAVSRSKADCKKVSKKVHVDDGAAALPAPAAVSAPVLDLS
jgi:hypothetical protein